MAKFTDILTSFFLAQVGPIGSEMKNDNKAVLPSNNHDSIVTTAEM